jgi:hypothetical protein
MTTATMLTILGDRMEDTAGDLFTDTVKERYLNRAQDKVIQALNPHLLTDLHVLKTGISMSTDSDVDTHFKSYFTPTNAGDLDSDPFGGPLGIMGIRIASSSFIRKVSFDMVKDFTTGYVAFSGTEPVYFIFKGRIYIYNNTANVDCYYIKEPTALATGSTGDLNAIFHDSILEFAEAELWRTVNNRERMATAQAMGYEYLSKYNQNPATGVVGEGLPFDYSSSNGLVDPIYPNYPIS